MNTELVQSSFLDQEGANTKPSDTTSTFVDNMRLPIHRWFRYSAGFSAQWVSQVLSNARSPGTLTLLDPFVGSGTTVLAGEACGVKSAGIEAHPFVARIATAKLSWHESIGSFRRLAGDVLDFARRASPDIEDYPRLIRNCYSEASLAQLDRLKTAWLRCNDHTAVSELTWLALTAILRPTAAAGTAPWQYVLPNKRKKHPVAPFEALAAQVAIMSEDMHYFQSVVREHTGAIVQDDARTCSAIQDSTIDLVLTSPPYANNYDYADATRLEMSFFGEVRGWGDLQTAVRRHLVRSCSQHVSADRLDLPTLLVEEGLTPIIEELSSACRELEKRRLQRRGRKNYHTMVAAYFSDLARVWTSLRRVCKPGATVCFVVGDSAPYGVHIPVERWLGELALAAGFNSYRFEKTRDRNVKWNIERKHNIPLREGRLWVEG